MPSSAPDHRRPALALIAGLAALTLLPMAGRASAETLAGLSSLQIVGNVPFRQQLKVAADTGFTHVRLGIRWNQLEKAKGKFNWGETDSKMKLVEAAGLTPIVTLFGNNQAYQKKNGKDQPAPSTDDAVRGYAAFARAVAERYGTEMSGRPIQYEIWNEPNTKTFWRPMPKPEDYVRMAAAACKAIRDVHADAVVLGLAMEGTPVKQPYFVRDYNIDIYQEWAKRAAQPEVMDCVSGISMHPYRSVPETYLDDEAALQDFLSASWKKSEKPLIVNSEWGITSAGKNDETRQAAIDLRILLVGAGTGRLTNIYQAVNGGKDEADESVSFGLVTIDGREKPAGAAFRRLFSMVGGYEAGSLTTPADGLYMLELKPDAKDAGKQPVHIAWSVKPGSGPLPKELRGENVEAMDLVTGEASPAPQDRSDIGESPKLIYEKGQFPG